MSKKGIIIFIIIVGIVAFIGIYAWKYFAQDIKDLGNTVSSVVDEINSQPDGMANQIVANGTKDRDKETKSQNTQEYKNNIKEQDNLNAGTSSPVENFVPDDSTVGSDEYLPEIGENFFPAMEPEYSVEYETIGQVYSKQVYLIDDVFYTYKLNLEMVPEGYDQPILAQYMCSRTTYRAVEEGQEIRIKYAFDRSGRLSINVIESI